MTQRSFPDGRRLRYVAIADDLRRSIESDIYKVGDQLPSQQELARQYGVSLTTLRAALELVQQEGFLRSEHGLGTFVTSAQRRRGRALAVDDDPLATKLLRALLEGSGVQVDAAYNGSEAVQKVREGEYDVIFLDLVMPNGDGVQTLAEFSRMGVETPVVIVTGQPEGDMIAQAMAYGPLTLILKPVQVHQIRSVLRSLNLMAAETTGTQSRTEAAFGDARIA